jgi:hypothetical protein
MRIIYEIPACYFWLKIIQFPLNLFMELPGKTPIEQLADLLESLTIEVVGGVPVLKIETVIELAERYREIMGKGPGMTIPIGWKPPPQPAAHKAVEEEVRRDFGISADVPFDDLPEAERKRINEIVYDHKRPYIMTVFADSVPSLGELRGMFAGNKYHAIFLDAVLKYSRIDARIVFHQMLSIVEVQIIGGHAPSEEIAKLQARISESLRRFCESEGITVSEPFEVIRMPEEPEEKEPGDVGDIPLS